MEYKLSDFEYDLPKNLIAQSPLPSREDCKMMRLVRESGTIENKIFRDIENYLKKDDILVLNDTKVYPARVVAKRKTGAKIEVFLLNPVDNSNRWEALCKRAKRAKLENGGEVLDVADDFKIRLIEKINSNAGEVPKYIVELIYQDKDVYGVLDKYGSIPLPPYISREATEEDKDNYQTVFAKNTGSCAAPTAGLHFTENLLQKIKDRGVKIAYVTLNVGLGTFSPVKVEDIRNHTMHFESYQIPPETADLINNKKGAVVSCGTTVLRCLEDSFQKYGKIKAGYDKTNIFIYPPYKIQAADKLITNFHLPKSTLLMLISAFARKDFVFRAYREAIKNNYRFFSYGDCMLIE